MATKGPLVSRSPKAGVIASLVVAIVLLVDQLSKEWALVTLGKVGSTVALRGPVDLTLVFNYSNAFGLVPVSGELTRWGLTALNVAVASILARVAVRRATGPLSTVRFACVVAGAI